MVMKQVVFARSARGRAPSTIELAQWIVCCLSMEELSPERLQAGASLKTCGHRVVAGMPVWRMAGPALSLLSSNFLRQWALTIMIFFVHGKLNHVGVVKHSDHRRLAHFSSIRRALAGFQTWFVVRLAMRSISKSTAQFWDGHRTKTLLVEFRFFGRVKHEGTHHFRNSTRHFLNDGLHCLMQASSASPSHPVVATTCSLSSAYCRSRMGPTSS